LRTLHFSSELDTEAEGAVLTNGALTVSLPKRSAPMPAADA
jgi:HSP20 family molecular chaperone IbpA